MKSINNYTPLQTFEHQTPDFKNQVIESNPTADNTITKIMKDEYVTTTQCNMTNWQRLEQVVKWSGMSTNRFALSIGLKRSENLYQIKRGNFGISKELARLISQKHPMISRLWLLTGEGQMLEGKASADSVLDTIKALDGAVPFYNIDALQVLKEDSDKLKPHNYLVIPALKNCDFAAQCSGNSMAPEMPAGSTLVFKEVSIETILPGEAYLVVTKDYTTIKYIRTVEDKPTKLQLVPKNTNDYDTITIESDKIIRLFIVKGVVNYTSM